MQDVFTCQITGIHTELGWRHFAQRDVFTCQITGIHTTESGGTVKLGMFLPVKSQAFTP